MFTNCSLHPLLKPGYESRVPLKHVIDRAGGDERWFVGVGELFFEDGGGEVDGVGFLNHGDEDRVGV